MKRIETAFYETVRALGQKQLDNLIIVGGWCPYLYATYVWRTPTPQFLTMDVDFAVKKMTPDLFSRAVYKKLHAAKLLPRRIDMDDDNRIQFAYLHGRTLVPIEFITAPSILPKGQRPFDRPYVACDAVPEVAIALKATPIAQNIRYKGIEYTVSITAPAAFVLTKALLLKHRINAHKIPKDLASIAFVMRYCPHTNALLHDLSELLTIPEAARAGNILASVLRNENRNGYRLLRPFFETWGCRASTVAQEVSDTFAPLRAVLNSATRTEKYSP